MHHPCAIGHVVGIVVAIMRPVVVADADHGRLVGSLHVAVSLGDSQAVSPERLVPDIGGTDADHELRVPVSAVHLADDSLVHAAGERTVIQRGGCLAWVPRAGI